MSYMAHGAAYCPWYDNNPKGSLTGANPDMYPYYARDYILAAWSRS